jgi:hypothetical protein
MGLVSAFFPDNFVAQFDALVTDEDGWSGDEFADFVLIFSAKGAVQHAGGVVLFFRHLGRVPWGGHRRSLPAACGLLKGINPLLQRGFPVC